MATMVLTVYGDDRAGLVDAISEVVAAHGGNWDKSYMAELAGKFAGIVSVSVADAKVDELSAGLAALEASGLEVTVHHVDEAPPATPHQELTLELFGQDHPGIIHDLSHALAVQGVSIAELSTETREAPMAGGVLFEARAILHAPSELSVQALAQSLEQVANDLSVDIELDVHIEVGSG